MAKLAPIINKKTLTQGLEQSDLKLQQHLYCECNA